jgi:heterodisulfide reductase subunit C1
MGSQKYQSLINDVRMKEGLNACMNCGICTAICPAAEYYDYDPRSIVVAVQSGNDEEITALLEGDEIWYCGQCMSCKTRCPRNNCPGLIICVLREWSQQTGAFVNSKFGRQQYLLIQSVGTNILKFGYCVHPSVITPEEYPEQGPVWSWAYENRKEVFSALGANLDGNGPGAMRKIPENDIRELHDILKTGGAIRLFRTIEKYSRQKALEMGFVNDGGDVDMVRYSEFLLNGEEV